MKFLIPICTCSSYVINLLTLLQQCHEIVVSSSFINIFLAGASQKNGAVQDDKDSEAG